MASTDPNSHPESPKTLDQLSNESTPGFVGEFWEFLKDNKKWWLLPILIVLGLLGVVVALMSTGAAPLIYTLF